jgi:hypothetical protein
MRVNAQVDDVRGGLDRPAATRLWKPILLIVSRQDGSDERRLMRMSAQKCKKPAKPLAMRVF